MARKTNCVKNGKQYYRVTASIGRDSNGKLIRKEFYGSSKKEAENKRDEYLNGIKNGLNIDYKNIILGELMHTWLFEIIRIKVKPSSFERYEGIYRNYIKNSKLFGLKLADLKTIQVQRYYNELYSDGKTSNVIKNLNKLLRAFFNYAVNEGYILRNPCLGSKIIIPGDKDNKEKEIEIFTDKEIKALKKQLEGNRLKCLILLALGSGLRQGELLALRWDDIDFKTNEIKVNKSIKRVKIIGNDGTGKRKTIEQSPKSIKSNRVVPIPSKLINALEEHKALQEKEKKEVGSSYVDKNLVFATKLGKPIVVKNLFDSYKRILVKSKIPHKKFHSLRHTYATKLFEKGVQLKTVQKLLGHKNISITADTYTHVMPKEKISAADKLNDLFD
ncbi:TPA: site-specific integrase [Clostridium botulinum]|nr:site-specific integrase [Clostridium botulinum]HDK7182987.1 site-specific integrase [Clostridium botulinum]HDK7186781.1 site-specific integrase [Clostridium botulinum]HDK7193307.1 site-specific integrase [Clostridium botulinum]HDK7205157.1 site-specific integrase [Clostridium botulinum]